MAYPTTIPVRLFKQGEYAVINGVKYVTERTCRIESSHIGPRYNVYKYPCSEQEWVESNTDPHASMIDGVCPFCGCKVETI